MCRLINGKKRAVSAANGVKPERKENLRKWVWKRSKKEKEKESNSESNSDSYVYNKIEECSGNTNKNSAYIYIY